MSASEWERVLLAEILTQVSDEVSIQDHLLYKQVTVRMHNKGLVLRQEVDGREIKTKRQFRIRAGQFVYSRIDARNGAMGLVPTALDAAIVSNDFPVFDIQTQRVDREFFKYCVSRAPFLDACLAASKGTSNRRRLKEPDFLSIPICIPTLDEQRRIVARIHALAARISEAQQLQLQGIEEATATMRSRLDHEYRELALSFGTMDLKDLCVSITDGNHITPRFTESGVKFIFVGNVSSGHLHFNNCKYVPAEYYEELRPQRQPQIGDVLYTAVGATLGIPAIVDKPDRFCFQRHVAILKPDRMKLDSRFLWYQLRCETVYSYAWANTTGSAQPTVPLAAIRRIPVSVPMLQNQRRVVEQLDRIQARVDTLKDLQENTQKELDALLPSVLDKAFRGEL